MNETTETPPVAMLLAGKFKDAAALERAYRELEAEFTKRCQRLRALEQAAQTAQALPAVPEQTPPAAPTPAAPPPAAPVSAEPAPPPAAPVTAEPAKAVPAQSAAQAVAQAVQTAVAAAQMQPAIDPAALLSDPEAFERMVADERLAGAVIARYLSALSRPAAPPTISGAAGATALTPALRPKTLAECKALADKYL